MALVKPAHCVGCPLESHGAVGYTKGTRNDILLVAQSPGTEEIKYGKILIGPSGQLLNKVFDVVGIQRSEMNLANSLGCFEGKGLSDATVTEAREHCRPLLVNFIKQIQPHMIIVCGAYALKSILSKDKISNKRGKIFQNKEFGCPVMVTLHPAAVLRECTRDYPNKPYETMNMRERDFLSDFRAAAEAIKGELWNSVDVFWKTDDVKERETEGKKLTRELDLSGYRKGTPEDALEIKTAKCISVDVELTGRIAETDSKLLSLSCTVRPKESTVYMADNIPTDVKTGLESDCPKIVVARPFDENCLEDNGIKLGGKKYDLLTVAHIWDENYYGFNLENIAGIYADMHNIKNVIGDLREHLRDATEEQVVKYNGIDSDAALRSFLPLWKMIKNEPRLLNYHNNFIMPVQDALAQIARNGCTIDREVLQANINQAQSEKDALEGQMIEMVPERILSKHRTKLKFSRPQFMRDIIFDGLKCKPNKKFVTDSKKEPQLTEEHLKEFSAKVPFIPLYLKWKKLTKIIDSYLTPLNKGEFIRPDGKIYPGTVLNRTVTGRSVILDPPMQTYPQHGDLAHLIKECVVPEPGWVFGSRDLSQSELRIAGWLANDKNILSAIKNGVDLHTNTAAKLILGVSIDKVTKEARRQAKPVNFGFIYGMSADSLQDYALNNYGVFISLPDCYRIRTLFFSKPDGYYSLPDYYREIEAEVLRTGFVDGVLGRRRRFPSCKGNQQELGSIAEKGIWGENLRQAINFKVQNFSSDLAIIGLMLFHRIIVREGLTHVIKPMWFIHDSILFQAREDYFTTAMRYLEVAMEELSVEYVKKYFGVEVGYRVESDPKVGISWEEMS